MNNLNNKHNISLLVSNKPGVLTRIALVFARRGYNIDSLVVSQAREPSLSRVNIESTGDEDTLALILNQLNRLIDVIKAVDHIGEDIIQRELALFKVRSLPEKRMEILMIADTFRAIALDMGESCTTFQLTGQSDKIEAFKSSMNEFGIMELIRTGKVVISRGEKSTA